MPPKVKKPVIPVAPKYRKHPNGQAFIEHRSIPNKSHRLYLGQYGSEESHQRYSEAVAQVLASGNAMVLPKVAKYSAAVSLCCLAYLEHAEGYYGPDTSEFHNLKKASKGLYKLYGSEQGKEFGPRSLLALQQHWVNEGYARTQVNRFTQMVKRLFRWCCQQELVPSELHHRLLCVEGLRAGKTAAKENAPIRAVDRQHVDALLPYLSPTIAAMVQVQYLCGMRPGEVCRIRGVDLITTGDVWLCRIPQHKGAWRNKELIKAVPEKAKRILQGFLRTDIEAFLFSPRESERLRIGKLHHRRRRLLRDHYDTATYQQGVDYGFDKIERLNAADTALASKEERAPQLVEIPHWHPNQLRHLIATEISQTLGEQAAQRWLGHAHLSTTGIYSEKQIKELVAIAQELDRRWAS